MNSFYIPPAEPFRFLTSQLSEELLRGEFETFKRILELHPEFRTLFDSAEATMLERNTCFTLLAHRRVMDILSDMFAARYERTAVLNNDDINLVHSTDNLVPADGPHWVLEIERVVDQLPSHLLDSLPLLLKLQFQSFNQDDKAQLDAFDSAAKNLGSVEQLQVFVEGVLDQQWDRLKRHWVIASTNVNGSVKQRGIKRRAVSNRDKLRIRRDQMIADIEDAAETNTEFLKLMDEREIRPQPTWSGWRGSWMESYKDPRLRRLIHQDKSRALSRGRRKK
jgi:hypothetical protein